MVELSGESRKAVTVSYKTADGTALAGEDYPEVALTELEFTSGVTAQTISVATTDDRLDEEDGETFTVTLSGPVNAELAAGGETATGTIDDNDDEPKVSITGAPVVVEGTAAVRGGAERGEPQVGDVSSPSCALSSTTNDAAVPSTTTGAPVMLTSGSSSLSSRPRRRLSAGRQTTRVPGERSTTRERLRSASSNGAVVAYD